MTWFAAAFEETTRLTPQIAPGIIFEAGAEVNDQVSTIFRPNPRRRG